MRSEIERYARSGKEPWEELSCQRDQRVRNRIRLHSVVFVAVWRHYSSFLEEQRNAVWGADLATAILLSTEIDAATLAGRSTKALASEFSEISSRMLERSQSAELGNG